jgi:hypothetical protein
MKPFLSCRRRDLAASARANFMTVFDPISGRQITIDPSGKSYRPIIRQECLTAGEQLHAGPTPGAEGRLKSPDLPIRHLPHERVKA